MNTNRIMERARLISIVQRLRRVMGDQQTLDLLHSVISTEFKIGLNTHNEKAPRSRTTKTSG